MEEQRETNLEHLKDVVRCVFVAESNIKEQLKEVAEKAKNTLDPKEKDYWAEKYLELVAREILGMEGTGEVPSVK